jgi:hypothetical protein
MLYLAPGAVMPWTEDGFIPEEQLKSRNLPPWHFDPVCWKAKEFKSSRAPPVSVHYRSAYARRPNGIRQVSSVQLENSTALP